MDWNRIVAENVRRLRLERQLSQEQLAHEAGLDLTYVGGIERGNRNPTVKALSQLAQALGTEPKTLLELTVPDAGQ